MTIFSLEHMISFLQEYDDWLPSHCYPMGYSNAAVIFVDSEVCQHSDKYLYWLSCIDRYERALKLNMNFETWLDLYIVAQGTEYWL